MYVIESATLTNNPQKINYSDLIDVITGESLPSKFSTPPKLCFFKSSAQYLYIPQYPDNTSLWIGKKALYPTTPSTINFYLILPSAVSSSLREMVDLFGIILGDHKEDEFSPQLKVWLLNRSQEYMIKLLNSNVVDELFEEITDEAVDANGDIDLTALDYVPFDKSFGLLTVRLTDSYICNKISNLERMKYINRTYSYSSGNSVYWVKGDKIHIEPYTASTTTVDIWMVRTPDTMVLGDTPSDDVVCELDNNLHDIVIGLACKDFVGRTMDAKMAYENAVNKINMLNEKSIKTDSLDRNIDRFYPDEMYDMNLNEGDKFIINFDY